MALLFTPHSAGSTFALSCLDVTDSTIPGAGRGLFTIIDRAKGAHLVDYFGELLARDVVEVRYPGNNVGTFSRLTLLLILLFGVGLVLRPMRRGALLPGPMPA